MTNVTTTTSRRAILAGAASLPALALPVGATTSPDPIYAAIDAHRTAYEPFIRACIAEMIKEDEITFSNIEEVGLAPFMDAREVAEGRSDGAAMALTTIQPTSVAGVVALLTYVSTFNKGGTKIADGWHSEVEQWPGGEKFAALVLDNVAHSLCGLAENVLGAAQ